MAVFTQRASGSWQAKVRRQGWPPQSKTFQTRAAAEAWARHVERDMDTESFLPSDEAARTTFATLVERYQNEKLPKLRGQVQDQYLLNRISEEFGEYSLARITPAMLSEYRDKRLKAVKEQTVAHELGMVSRLFNAAILDWKIAVPKGNPVEQIRKPTISNDRSRRLEGNEEELLLDALLDRESPWPHAAAVLAIETAARMSELLAIRWSEVDLDARIARVRGKDGGVTKGGDPYRDIPLTSRAVALLKDLPRSINGMVLPISQNALQIAWGRALKQARKRHVHQMLGRQLAAAGYDEEEQAREVRALVYKKREPRGGTRKRVGEIEGVGVGVVYHPINYFGDEGK
jgi:integrase